MAIGGCGSLSIDASFTRIGRGMPVINFAKIAIARKQYFAGLVNGKRTGRTCAVSYSFDQLQFQNGEQRQNHEPS